MTMDYKEVYLIVKEAFEQAGIVFSPDDDDLVLSEYITDSIQYITSIVNIENALDIEVPDEYLLPERMSTLKAFSEALTDLMKGNEANDDWDD